MEQVIQSREALIGRLTKKIKKAIRCKDFQTAARHGKHIETLRQQNAVDKARAERIRSAYEHRDLVREQIGARLQQPEAI